MVKRPGCVSHFLSSEAQRRRTPSAHYPSQRQQLPLHQLRRRPHWTVEELGWRGGDVKAGDGGVMVIGVVERASSMLLTK